MNKNKLAAYLAAVMGTALIAGSTAFAGSEVSTNAPVESPLAFNLPTVSQWWNGNSATANWLGLGYLTQDYGLTISGGAKETFQGQITPNAYPQKAVGSGKNTITGSSAYPGGPMDTWLTEVKVNFTYDFGKIFGLQGLTAESDWRYRSDNGSQTDYYTRNSAGTLGNSSMFDPQKDNSGMGLRIMAQYLQYQSDMSKDPQFLMKLGWMNPYESFLSQPESKYYQNNAIAAAKGIGSAVNGYYQPGAAHNNYSVTSVPWTSTYDTWGGEFRVKPTSDSYFKSFLGLAIAGEGGSASTPQNPNGYNNHGFNFQGTAPFNPNQPSNPGNGVKNTYGYVGASYNYGQTGVYQMNELGWTPKFGDAKLDGHYALGSYIWGQNNNSYGSLSGNADVWGLYIQGDQRLTAVKTSAPAAPSLSKNPAPAASTAYDKTRGLYLFSEATYTPANISSIPLYYQIGLNYHGLFDARPNDVCGFAVGEGFYSQNLNSAINASYVGTSGANGAINSYKSQNYSTTCVGEIFYNVAINKWMSFAPFAQYLINPAGNGSCDNAAVVGAQLAVKF
jgi:hypothetical protein